MKRETIIGHSNPAGVMEAIYNQPPIYIFVWENMIDNTLQLRKFHTTCKQWPAFQSITLSTEQVEISNTYYTETKRFRPRYSNGIASQLYTLMDMLDLDPKVPCIHVTYEAVSMTKASEFRACIHATEKWKELIFVPIPYDEAHYNFESFSVETVHGLIVKGVTPFTNANEDVALAIAYAYQQQS